MSHKVTAVLITREREWPKDCRVDFDFDEVLIETNCVNVRRRFELAKTAKNDIIYVQDDDNVIDISKLWEQYDGRLTHAITDGHAEIYAGTGVTLIGFGAFFPKSLIDFSRWEADCGEVDAMEADRIFTYLAQPHNSVFIPIMQIDRPVKMCYRPGHYERKNNIIEQLRRMK